MCTRFVYNGDDTITGFNFEIDLSVWSHKVIPERDRFFIGIRAADGGYHSYHGVNSSGSAATLLYVHGNDKATFSPNEGCVNVATLNEEFIKGRISFDEAVRTVETKRIVYAPDATMQTLLSCKDGRTLIVEPGIGYRNERKRYSLITNYSVLRPESTSPYIVEGDDRYERTKALLEAADPDFSVKDAFAVLKAVSQEGIWATRVSFVYSAKQNRVYYVENNNFSDVMEWSFAV